MGRFFRKLGHVVNLIPLLIKGFGGGAFNLLALAPEIIRLIKLITKKKGRVSREDKLKVKKALESVEKGNKAEREHHAKRIEELLGLGE